MRQGGVSSFLNQPTSGNEDGTSADAQTRASRWRASAGIALGPIIFLIAIIAILASIVAAGIGAFNGNTNNESGSIQAAAIIQVAEGLQLAVQKVYIDNGCDASQINMQNGMVTTGSSYTNPNAPSDGRCNVFDPRGGGIVFPTIKASTQETEDNGLFVCQAAINFYGQGSGRLTTSGTAALACFLPIDSVATCNAINARVGLFPTAPPNPFWGYYDSPTDWKGHFEGAFASPTTTNDPTNPGVPMGIAGTLGIYGISWPRPVPMMGCSIEGGPDAPLERNQSYFSPKIANYFFWVILLVN